MNYFKRENYAASKIQAVWRGYTARKQLERANQAMKRFHNSFRFGFFLLVFIYCLEFVNIFKKEKIKRETNNGGTT